MVLNYYMFMIFSLGPQVCHLVHKGPSLTFSMKDFNLIMRVIFLEFFFDLKFTLM